MIDTYIGVGSVLILLVLMFLGMLDLARARTERRRKHLERMEYWRKAAEELEKRKR
jgi:flagellar biosynthesis/type III secretory pathway M-ring protein FliF/YscJ